MQTPFRSALRAGAFFSLLTSVPEMVKAGRMVRRHWEGSVAYLRTGVTNGATEALNGIIQTVKRKSCGFRTFE